MKKKAKKNKARYMADDDNLLHVDGVFLLNRLEIQNVVLSEHAIATAVRTIRGGHLFRRDGLSPIDVRDVFAFEDHLFVLSDDDDGAAIRELPDAELRHYIQQHIRLLRVNAAGENAISLTAQEYFTHLRLRALALTGPHTITPEQFGAAAVELHGTERLSAIYDWQAPSALHPYPLCFGILHYASWCGRVDVIREMVSGVVRNGTQGANPMVLTPTKGYPALHTALGSVVAQTVSGGFR